MTGIDASRFSAQMNQTTMHVDEAIEQISRLDADVVTSPGNRLRLPAATASVDEAMSSLSRAIGHLPDAQRSGLEQMLLDLGCAERSLNLASADVSVNGRFGTFGADSRAACDQLTRISKSLHGGGYDGVVRAGWSAGAKLAAVGGVLLLGGAAAAIALRDR